VLALIRASLAGYKAPSAALRNRVEAIEQVERALAKVRKVECKRRARTWEGKQSWRGEIAEQLEHSEEGSGTGARNLAQELRYCRFCVVMWDHTLILQQSLVSIDAVPRAYRIERVEKPRVMHRRACTCVTLFSVVQRIEKREGSRR
jgi:hypothetical protein